MSRFSGKCDFYDYISMEKMYPKEGNPNVLVSDDLECFEIFKKKTGGVIHQWRTIHPTFINIDELIKLGKVEEIKYVTKDGKNRRKFKVYDKVYPTIKSMKDVNIGVVIDIHFETILDLIPYFPYLISMSFNEKGKSVIYISNESFVETELNKRLTYALKDEDKKRVCEMARYYRKQLQNYYVDIVHRLDTDTKVLD